MKYLKYYVMAFALFGIVGVAYANQSAFTPQAKTSTATTTIDYLRPGLATSTVTYDSYGQNGTNQPVGYKPITTDGAILFIQLTASSTVSNLTWSYEYSDDGIDWYADAIVPTIVNATSTGAQSLTPNNSYSWLFASSTSKCDSTVPTGTNTRGCKAVAVQTFSRYVRVVFSLPAGSANAGVYAQFIPRKQNP